MTNATQDHKPVFSILIVNYNSGELTGRCIETIFGCVDETVEVIVWDNGSADGSLAILEKLQEKHKRLRVTGGKGNLGFAKANNLAAKEAQGLYFHFLNPDMLVNASLPAAYADILKNRERSLFVTELSDTTGAKVKNRHLVPRIGNLIRKLSRTGTVAYWNLGASVIIHREVFQEIGGWPEEYFMYAEDLDLFYTAYRKQIPVRYLDASLTHIGGGVTGNIWSREQRALLVERSFRKFFQKYHAGWEYLLVRPVQLIYILVREPGEFLLYAKVFLKTLFSPS